VRVWPREERTVDIFGVVHSTPSAVAPHPLIYGAPEGDPLLFVGDVAVPDDDHPCANIVCELQEGRLRWSLLRFTASPPTGSYRYGPVDRPHGLMGDLFVPQRPYMIRSGMHVWQMQQTPLTAEAVVDLLREAISRS
jgi:hypothetical protein